MILYHAISSYQLLCIITHKLLFYPNSKAILVLPDFIVEKYPQYMKLVELKLFSEVYLFPYLHIQHDETLVQERVQYYYSLLIPYKLAEFKEIFIAGAHFYFTLYLIKENVSFHFFEDAPGMLHNADVLYNNLMTRFPVHANIAQGNKLFDGNNPLVIDIFCMYQGNKNKKYIEFNVNKWLKILCAKDKKRILDFFGLSRIRVPPKSVVFLTQQFANLGIMDSKQQKVLIETIVAKIQIYSNVIVKKHPDDNIIYDFSDKTFVLSRAFPVELLPFIVKPVPESVITISSTSIDGLKGIFKNVFSFAEMYSDVYSFNDEYASIMNIINNKRIEEKLDV